MTPTVLSVTGLTEAQAVVAALVAADAIPAYRPTFFELACGLLVAVLPSGECREALRVRDGLVVL